MLNHFYLQNRSCIFAKRINSLQKYATKNKMRKVVYTLLMMSLFVFSGCMKHDFNNDDYANQQIDENVQKVFGAVFDKNHDWCTTTNGSIKIQIPAGTEKVQLLAYVSEDDATSLLILNEADVNGQSEITMSYDVPDNHLGMMISFISGGSYTLKFIDGVAKTRGVSGTRSGVSLPESDLRITGSISSYASDRGWIPGELLYHTNIPSVSVSDYDDEYKAIFRTLIFSYFKNGRKYNNLPLVKNSGYYNSSYYPFTTGKDPIIISPVYKNDGGYKEVENSDLYYYYFKDEDITGDPVAFLESLPKYKAIQFNQCIKGDDVIQKHVSYGLVYWGDGTPDENTVGTYQFPEGYKIGFMVRAMTTAEGGKKQGELYGDGRLNNYINSYSKCNFKSSNLGTDGPRAGWMTVNGKMLLCLESGTDTDFNDIILEVEGGVEPIIVIPELENNFYTFCFEDTQLGDYDMNDVVIKAKRVNETTVEYELMACGANDKLKIMNINGNAINGNTDVHSMFGVNGEFVNTVTMNHDPIIDRVTVAKTFSFLDPDTQPYIINTTKGNTVKISKKGEDPHGIMIPYDFRWAKEKVCIKDAYELFNNWGANPVVSTDWYKYPTDGKVM